MLVTAFTVCHAGAYQSFKAMLLTVGLLQYVCININPHIPAAKIILVFMDQESVHQTASLAADLCECGSDKHTCC